MCIHANCHTTVDIETWKMSLAKLYLFIKGRGYYYSVNAAEFSAPETKFPNITVV